jgi:MATE family multidrug resistance protein
MFVYGFNFGLYGAPIATGISYWLSFLLLVCYAAFVQGHECWGGVQFSRSIRQLLPFTTLALLGVVHIGTEWWAFEIVALAAGRLGTTALAAQSVIMTADQVINTIPFGLGVSTSIRIGNLLGLGDHKRARFAAHTSAILSIMMGVLLLSILLATRHIFARAFNDDEQVVSLVADVIPYVAVFQIADGLNGSCGGTLRGMGKQWVGAAVNMVSYYLAALPLGIYLAFNGWGLPGLWIGQCLALYLVGWLEWLIVALSNWKRECRLAVDRLDDGGRAAL